jgi:ketosteroid isomerase-like protein
MQSDVDQIRTLTNEFVAGFNSGDVERIMKFYADTFVDVNLTPPVQTKAERAEYYRKLVAPGQLKVDVTPDEIIVTGDHAFARGTILIRDTRKPAEEQARELRYIEVWRKFPDGWKSIWGIDASLHD